MAEPGPTAEPWVVFALDRCEYALPVSAVVEVLPMVALTPVPDARLVLAGLLNLRGAVLPALYGRELLHLPGRSPDLNTPILVARADDRQVGLIVDQLLEVCTPPRAAVSRPDADAGFGASVLAVGCLGERLILLLDAGRLVREGLR
jgi:purine-binding chemotaxis protein CheW